MDQPWLLLAVVAATALGGFVQGCIGFGMGLVVLPVMGLVMPERLPQEG